MTVNMVFLNDEIFDGSTDPLHLMMLLERVYRPVKARASKIFSLGCVTHIDSADTNKP